MKIRCPFCDDDSRLGTNESIPGTAWADLMIGEDGQIEVEHHGETGVWYDDSTTDEAKPYSCGACGTDFDARDVTIDRVKQAIATYDELDDKTAWQAQATVPPGVER
jgi:hypothetical protein